MINQLDALGKKSLQAIEAASSLSGLEEIRIQYLGKKGELSQVLRALANLDPEERKKVGAFANELKVKLEAALDDKKSGLEGALLQQKMEQERVDITLPARRNFEGALHPLTQTTRKIVAALSRLGFHATTGPEVDTEFLNFDAINIASDHPARDMQDTFFLSPGVVLRTHTSPVQMRTMLSQKWPVRVLCPGAVYRVDNDATHSPMFHQIEGLWVDRNVKMSDLKGTLAFFAREIFGSETSIRLRPSYFPFVEPGAEMDVSCFACRGKKKDTHCSICKNTGWIEVLGAGMVHPHLFQVAGYDPREVSGFAFGMGIERISMLLYQIPDLRLFYQGDVRFLNQLKSV